MHLTESLAYLVSSSWRAASTLQASVVLPSLLLIAFSFLSLPFTKEDRQHLFYLARNGNILDLILTANLAQVRTFIESRFPERAHLPISDTPLSSQGTISPHPLGRTSGLIGIDCQPSSVVAPGNYFSINGNLQFVFIAS